MTRAERHERMVAMCRQARDVHTLAAVLGVSRKTVRRDLAELVEAGRVFRVRRASTRRAWYCSVNRGDLHERYAAVRADKGEGVAEAMLRSELPLPWDDTP